MKSVKVSEESLVTTDQIINLMNQIGSGVITNKHMRALLRGVNPFLPVSGVARKQLSKVGRLFSKLNIACDLSQIDIPVNRKESNWLVPVPVISAEELIEKVRESNYPFNIYVNCDWGKVLTKKNTRCNISPYAVWVAYNYDDSEGYLYNPNKYVNSMNLIESLLFILIYFEETGVFPYNLNELLVINSSYTRKQQRLCVRCIPSGHDMSGITISPIGRSILKKSCYDSCIYVTQKVIF